jgi:hypothetical protein
MCMLLAFNVCYKLTTLLFIRAVPKMVSTFVCNQCGFRCEMDEVNLDDRIHWKCHIHIRTLGGIQTSNVRNDVASIVRSPLARKRKTFTVISL